MNTPLLRVSDLGHRFGGHEVLAGVNLVVERGQFVALLGPSGAGKTTLIKCITGLMAPECGEVRVAGTPLASLHGQERRRLAVVFQQFNLVRRRTALDNVLMGRLGHVSAWRGLTGQFEHADRLWAMQCLDRVGLLDLAGQRADTLSGGQQQRVAIARALAQRAELIVADEPVASLDPASSAGILGLLRSICREEGVGVVCSLHQLHLAKEFADRLVGMANGRVRFDGHPMRFDAAATAALYDSGSTPIRRSS